MEKKSLGTYVYTYERKKFKLTTCRSSGQLKEKQDSPSLPHTSGTPAPLPPSPPSSAIIVSYVLDSYVILGFSS